MVGWEQYKEEMKEQAHGLIWKNWLEAANQTCQLQSFGKMHLQPF